jgi:hypothetical protein
LRCCCMATNCTKIVPTALAYATDPLTMTRHVTARDGADQDGSPFPWVSNGLSGHSLVDRLLDGSPQWTRKLHPNSGFRKFLRGGRNLQISAFSLAAPQQRDLGIDLHDLAAVDARLERPCRCGLRSEARHPRIRRLGRRSGSVSPPTPVPRLSRASTAASRPAEARGLTASLRRRHIRPSVWRHAGSTVSWCRDGRRPMLTKPAPRTEVGSRTVRQCMMQRFVEHGESGTQTGARSGCGRGCSDVCSS